METFLVLLVGVDRNCDSGLGGLLWRGIEEDQPAFISEGERETHTHTPPQPVHPSNQIRTITFPYHRSPAVPSSS